MFVYGSGKLSASLLLFFTNFEYQCVRYKVWLSPKGNSGFKILGTTCVDTALLSVDNIDQITHFKVQVCGHGAWRKFCVTYSRSLCLHSRIFKGSANYTEISEHMNIPRVWVFKRQAKPVFLPEQPATNWYNVHSAEESRTNIIRVNKFTEFHQ